MYLSMRSLVKFMSTNQIRQYARRARNRQSNPGIQNQLSMYAEPEKSNIDLEHLELDDLESDFSSVHKSHKEFGEEMERYKEMEKFWIVKRKYFKEDNVNFLTWSEKEQIRYLHEKDPLEWSVERLAESFPASENTVVKILKSTWKTDIPKRILSHDKSVEKNWKLLRKNKIPNIDERFKKHLQSFTSRENIVYDKKYLPSEHLEEEKSKFVSTSNEYSSIITSYEELKNKNEQKLPANKLLEENSDNVTRRPRKEMYVMTNENPKDLKHVTLNQLRHNVTQVVEGGLEVTEDEKAVYLNSKLNKNMEKCNTEHIQFEHKENEPSFVTVLEKKQFKTKAIADFINIPKHLWKEGGTFKVEDCYYDDDGEFLYRIPGMDGKTT